MRRGFDGLSRPVQEVLGHDPFSGHLFVFRGWRGDLVPSARDGVVSLTPAQLSMLLEGIDWRMPARTWQPEMAG